MKKIKNKAIRAKLKKILNAPQTAYKKNNKKLFLKDIDNTFKNIQNSLDNAKLLNNKKFEEEFSVTYMLISTLGMLASSVFDEGSETKLFPADWIASDNKPNPNFITQCLLIQLTNHSLGTVNLLKEGMDSSARVLLRTITEFSFQILILIRYRDDFIKYTKGMDEESSATVWFDIFAKKNALNKKIHNIHKELGIPDQISNNFKQDSKSESKFYSQSTHNSYVSVVLGSFGGEHDDSELLTSLLFGGENAGMQGSIYHLNQTLMYFLLTFYSIFDIIHSIKEQDTWVESYSMFLVSEELFTEVYGKNKS